MVTLLLIWVMLMGVLLVVITRKDRSGVLLLSYAVSLAIIHVPGVINHLGDGIGGFAFDETLTGFKLTLFGFAALLAGALIMRLSFRQRKIEGKLREAPRRFTYRQLALFFIALGLSAFFATGPLNAIIPGIAALSNGMVALLIVGMWMIVSDALDRGNHGRLGLVLACLLALPFATLLTGGFLGYGVTWLVMIFSLLVILHPSRKLMVLAAPIIGYIGMSFAVAYLGEREQIRASLEDEVPLAERLRYIPAIFERFEAYDLDDSDHAFFIDIRFNQNYFVGLTVDRLAQREIRHELGGTVPLWALIPRAIWPDKPEVGGGGNLVEEATGLRLDEESSFGAGQPLEFYLNFGWGGVIVGFALWGALLTWLDRRISVALRQRDVAALVLAGMPGVALVQPGGNLMEIFVAVIAATLVAQGLALLLRGIDRGGRQSSVSSTARKSQFQRP